MTIACLISNPINEIEKNFSFPFAFEKVYTDYWQKFAQENQCFWLQAIQFGIDIPYQNIVDVENEIKLFQEFLLSTNDGYYTKSESFNYLINRIAFILTKFAEIKAMRNDIIIWIG